MATSTLIREAARESRQPYRSPRSVWPVVFWAGAAVGQFGAIHPEWSYPWRPTAFLGAALLVGLGLLIVHTGALKVSRRLSWLGYVAGAMVLAHQFGTTANVTSLSRTGSILLYGTALVMAVWSFSTRSSDNKSPLLIASGIGPRRLRALLATLPGDTVALYRTAAPTDELRELEARHGLVLVVGDEHDPRAKEQVSASGLHRLVPDIGDRHVMVIGPRSFRKYVHGALARLDVPVNRVKRRQRA